MSQQYVVMDLETVPNPDMNWEPSENNPNMFPPLPIHKIVCAAGLTFETGRGGNRCHWIGTFGKPGDERSMVEDFIRLIEGKTNPTLITFNGRGFDIYAIMYRAMHYGLQFPTMFEYDFNYRFKWGRHIDLSDWMRGHGASPPVKLDYAAQAIGLPGKFDVAGSDVSKLIQEGKQDIVDAYGQCDVIQTTFLLNRFMHVMGRMSAITHNNLMHSIKTKALGLGNDMISKLIKIIDFSVLEINNEATVDSPGTEGHKDYSDEDLPF